MKNTNDDERRDILGFSGFCDIEPVPKGRPRFARRGKYVTTYTPKKTEEYENAVRKWMIREYGNNHPLDGELKATFEFILPRPKSRKHQKYSNTKPDCDNYIKSFMDALDFKKKDENGTELGVIANDSRMSSISATKRYANEGERCGTVFNITSIYSELAVFIDSTMENDRVSWFIREPIQSVSFDDIESFQHKQLVRRIIVMSSIDMDDESENDIRLMLSETFVNANNIEFVRI